MGKQWCNSDPVGIYITPEELTDYYRIFQLFRIRGGSPKPGKPNKPIDKKQEL